MGSENCWTIIILKQRTILSSAMVLLPREELFVIIIPGEISSIKVPNSGPIIMVSKAKRPIQVCCQIVMLISL